MQGTQTSMTNNTLNNNEISASSEGHSGGQNQLTKEFIQLPDTPSVGTGSTGATTNYQGT